VRDPSSYPDHGLSIDHYLDLATDFVAAADHSIDYVGHAVSSDPLADAVDSHHFL